MNKNLYLVLLWTIFLSCLSAAQGAYYYIEMISDHETGKLSQGDLSLVEGGFGPDTLGVDTHEMRLYSFNGKILYNFTFYISPYSYEYYPVEEDSPPLPKTSTSVLSISIPFHNNGKKIDIINLETRDILSIDVSEYASCNEDDICDITEDIGSCPKDCAAERKTENFIEEEPASNLSMGKTAETRGDKSPNIYILLGVASILVIFVVVILFRKRNIYK